VLSLSLSLAISALLCLPFVRGPVPLFGATLTGAAAAAVTLIAAAALGALAVAAYRLSSAGWWGTLAAVVLFTIVSVDMSFRVDLAKMLADVSLATADGIAAPAGSSATDAAAAGFTECLRMAPRSGIAPLSASCVSPGCCACDGTSSRRARPTRRSSPVR
jgi:hypothetical protein